MTTTARVGIDIVGMDRTAAAFASVKSKLTAFTGGLGVLKGAIAGAFAGFAAGGFLQGMIRGFVNVNKHVAGVKQSFTTVDRAWQQFALNVGRSGLNDAIVRFNETLAGTMVNGRSLAAIFGQGLGAAFDGFARLVEGTGRAIEFLSVNLEIITQKLNGFFAMDIFKGGSLFDFSDDIRILNALGLNTDALTRSTKDLKGGLKNLPATFAEVDEAQKKAEERQKKLLAAYRGGMKTLQDFANGLLLQSQTFGMSEAAANRYTKKYEFLNRMQQEGVKLSGQQVGEMNRWLDVISQSGLALEKQKSAFEGMEKMKSSMADLVGDVGKAFAGSIEGGVSKVMDGTESIKKAFRSTVADILKSLTSLALNRMFQSLMGGYTAGAGGIAGKGTGVIGRVIGSLFGGHPLYGGGMPSFAVGTSRVPRDMVAQIHKDEMIIPAREANALRAGAGGGVSVTVNNYAGVEVRTQDKGNGGLQIDIRKIVSDVIAGGGADKAMRRFALNPAGVTR